PSYGIESAQGATSIWPLPHRERGGVRGNDLSVEPEPLTPTLSPTGRGSAPSTRRYRASSTNDHAAPQRGAKSATRSCTPLVSPSNMPKLSRLTATKTPTPRVGASTT